MSPYIPYLSVLLIAILCLVPLYREWVLRWDHAKPMAHYLNALRAVLGVPAVVVAVTHQSLPYLAATLLVLAALLLIAPSFALKSWAADGTALITTGDVRPEDGTDHPGPIQRINIADGTVTSTAIPSHVFGDITVSPDGSRIAYLIYGVTSEYSQVAVAELGGATEQLVGDHTYSAWAYAGYLAWSREGALALVRVTKTGSHYDERLFVARPPATTITQVFDLGGLSPSWSADGTRLACLVSFEAPSGTPKIAVVNAVDGGVTYVPGVSSASFVSWQP